MSTCDWRPHILPRFLPLLISNSYTQARVCTTIIHVPFQLLLCRHIQNHLFKILQARKNLQLRYAESDHWLHVRPLIASLKACTNWSLVYIQAPEELPRDLHSRIAERSKWFGVSVVFCNFSLVTGETLCLFSHAFIAMHS